MVRRCVPTSRRCFPTPKLRRSAADVEGGSYIVPDPALVDRFRSDLDALIEPGAKLGLAVSGGPDSLAMLLLAAAVRPGGLEAATVDHGLRPDSRAEAEMVGSLCDRLGVPHSTLVAEWDLPPTSAIQEQARAVRYGALAKWLRDRQLAALLTAHHLDDQAETMLMRLNRGSGVRGLAGMRRRAPVPDDPEQLLLRPLLDWRRAELERVCKDAGVSPAHDPGNDDPKHERVRVRQALAGSDWLNLESIASSADHLAAGDEALDWAVSREWSEKVDAGADRILYRAPAAPTEIVRRIVARAISELATEGTSDHLRGRELDRLIADLEGGRTSTLRGVRCSGGLNWGFSAARARRQVGPATDPR